LSCNFIELSTPAPPAEAPLVLIGRMPSRNRWNGVEPRMLCMRGAPGHHGVRACRASTLRLDDFDLG
jgi:hypothetical protein